MKKLLTAMTIVVLPFWGCDGQSGPTVPDEAATPRSPSAGLDTDRARLSASPFLIEDVESIAERSPVRPGTRDLQPAAGRFVVDEDGVECPDAGFATIQAAVDAAAATSGTDRIFICAGTYPENVSIGPDNRLVLEGDGVDATIVTGASGTAGPVFDVVDAGRVDIARLAVDGQSKTGESYGLRYTDTDGNVDRIEARDLFIGLAFLASPGATPKDMIRKSRVEDFTRVGVLADGVGLDIKVEDNVIVGPENSTAAPNGVQISRGATSDVRNNEVSDANFPGDPNRGIGSGILIFCAGESTVQLNTVLGADGGIAVADNQGATVQGNDVRGSLFDGISLQFLGLFFGPLGCPGENQISPTFDNVIKDNRVDDSTESGISLLNADPASAPDTPSRNVVENNDVTDSGLSGLGVFDGTDNLLEKNRVDMSGEDGIFADAGTSDNLFQRNDVTGSGVFSCEDESTGGGTAGTANTWTRNEGEAPSSPSEICE